MTLTRFAAILGFAAIPLWAQAQQGGTMKTPTVADAQKVVQMIKADKAKLKIYCDIGVLAEEADAAEEKKDSKTAEAIADKMDAMAERLGPEYIALMDGLQDMDENSKAVQDIGMTLGSLDEMCAN